MGDQLLPLRVVPQDDPSGSSFTLDTGTLHRQGQQSGQVVDARRCFACQESEVEVLNLSRCRICGLKGWQGMTNSNTSPILACVNSTVSGESYAQVHYHPDTRQSLPLRQRLLPAAPGLPGQRQSHGHDSLDGPLRCRGADLLDLRDLPPPDRRPQRGDLRQGPLRPALLPRSTQTQGQRRLRRPPAQGPAQPPQATTPRRHRSDLDPLLWPAPAWPPRDLPLQGPVPARSSPTPPPT